MENEEGIILFMTLLFFTFVPIIVYFVVRDRTKNPKEVPKEIEVPKDIILPPVEASLYSGYSGGYSGGSYAGTDCGLYYPTLHQAQSSNGQYTSPPPAPPPPPSYWTPYFVNYYA